MRFLADESCDFSVVRILRAAGHDVLAVADVLPRADDEIIMDRTVREGRILLTEDKDFGQLVYANAKESGGVIFIRFPGNARTTLPGVVLDLVNQMGEQLTGRFVVVQPGRIRIAQGP